MGKKLWWIAVIVWPITAARAQSVALEGVTSVKISLQDPKGVVPVLAQVFHTFPPWEISEVADTISAERKEIWLRCPIHTTQEGYVFIGKTQIPLLMIPGDTIYISLSARAESHKVWIEGKTKDIQTYQLARLTRFPARVDQLLLNFGQSTPDLMTFKARADSLYLLDKRFWADHQKKQNFPSWFVRYETDAIRYRYAYLSLYTLTYQTVVQQKEQSIPDKFFEFLKTTPLLNEAAMYDDYYLRFLREYLRYRARAGTATLDQDSEFKLAREMLGDKVGEFYILYSIGSYLISDPGKVKADLEKRTFPASLKYLVDFLIARADTQVKKLGPGDFAPEFYLEDEYDSLISLSQFRNHVVYLSFWFPGCKGCIQEFPFENALVEKFQGKPVKIINICTRTSKTKWVETIERYGLKTMNLYANDSWQNRLEEEYGIRVYPHYVLINGEGLVIENFAARPSHVAEGIQKALGELKQK